MQTLSGTDLATSANERFASADPRDILRWAIEEAGFDRIGVASAFQAEGTVVMHMATEIRRDIPVLFLQTGFHFAEGGDDFGCGCLLERHFSVSFLLP